MGLLGEGAEIGVYEGDFSRCILSKWKGRLLYSVDPWKHQGDNWYDKSDVSQKEHDIAYQVAKMNLHEFGRRSKIVRDFGVGFAYTLMDEQLDFVYIDARHDYRSVAADLRHFYPKVKVGGIIAGHDYKDSFVRKNLVEVKRAVDDFFGKEKVLTTTRDNLPSWYVIKEETSERYVS